MGGVSMEQVNSPWGLLPKGWRLSTIDEEKERLTDYVANGSFASLASNVHYKDTEDYAVLIRLVDFNNDFKGPFVYIDEHAYNFLSKSSLSGGEIIISNVGANVGTIFKCPNLPYKMSLAPNAITIKLKGDNDFYYYWFKSKIGQANIQALVTGSAQPKFNKTNFRSMYIPVPPLATQRRIASILSSLDRKIELNNKINADLEEMAQAIFKNWFVDFEPFKDGKFVDSELGMIPEGWKVSQIADIPHILETGKRPKGGAVEKGIPSVGAEHVKGMCAYDYSKTKYINCEFAAKLKTGKINGYELMIYKDGGKPGYFIPNFSIFGEGYPFENCYLNEHVFKLDFNGNKGFNIFCYFFFKTEQIMSYFNAQGAKAAIPGINKKDVENIYILSPENESVIKFGEFAYPLFKQMLKNAIENSRLSLLRDTLLPRLMSGELEVPE